MSPTDVLNELSQHGILPPDQARKLGEIEQNRPFSLHWELRAALYVGILLLSSGLGLLIYDNFDRIGHGALLAAIVVACAGVLVFAWRNRPAWTAEQTKSRSTFGDYALILACLLFLTLEGYAQYAYNVFGERYGLVTLLPALLFLPLAYRFDHRGVLGMALTALISWVGVTVRPLELYFKTNFFSQTTVFSAIGLAVVLIGVALFLEQRRIKAHFTDTYLTIAGNLLMIALLGGLFNFDNLRVGFALGLAVAGFVFDRYARRRRAFLFLLMSTVYGYIGVTYLVFHYLNPDGIETYYWYFIITGVGLATYLTRSHPNETGRMRAYNVDWVYNREIVRQAERWHRQRLLTDGQWAAVEQTYPSEFRQTSGYLDIGLFLFATLGILGAYLLVSTVLSGLLFSDRIFYGIFNLLTGIAVGVLGRVLARQQRLYRNGTDNAFVATMTGFLVFGFNQLLPTEWSIAAYRLATLPLLLLILWYYGDTLIAFVTGVTFYTFVFDGMLQFSWGKDALPFVMMAVSIVLFQLVKRRSYLNHKTYAYYADALSFTEWTALIVLAASGNYYVVRELNALLLSPSPPVAPEIALPGLLWALTLAIPVLYLQQGLAKTNRMLIILGGLGLIAAVATVHEYTALMPLNVMLTLGGLALIGVAVVVIWYLRAGAPDGSKHGFTDAPDEESPDVFRANAETLVAMQATAGASHAPKDNLRFGGGNFGGGGSEGNY